MTWITDNSVRPLQRQNGGIPIGVPKLPFLGDWSFKPMFPSSHQLVLLKMFHVPMNSGPIFPIPLTLGHSMCLYPWPWAQCFMFPWTLGTMFPVPRNHGPNVSCSHELWIQCFLYPWPWAQSFIFPWNLDPMFPVPMTLDPIFHVPMNHGPNVSCSHELWIQCFLYP